jgi:hypothetical protein
MARRYLAYRLWVGGRDRGTQRVCAMELGRGSGGEGRHLTGTGTEVVTYSCVAGNVIR